MSFRNIKNIVPKEHDSAKLVILQDDKFVDVNLHVSLPSSNDYCLKDLLASGQRVVPVDTSILHDDVATSQVVTTLMSQPDTTDNQ